VIVLQSCGFSGAFSPKQGMLPYSSTLFSFSIPSESYRKFKQAILVRLYLAYLTKCVYPFGSPSTLYFNNTSDALLASRTIDRLHSLREAKRVEFSLAIAASHHVYEPGLDCQSCLLVIKEISSFFFTGTTFLTGHFLD